MYICMGRMGFMFGEKEGLFYITVRPINLGVQGVSWPGSRGNYFL